MHLPHATYKYLGFWEQCQPFYNASYFCFVLMSREAGLRFEAGPASRASQTGG